jgi:transposase
MIQIHLTETERNELKAHRTTRNSNLSERCLYILLSDEGKSVPEIAEVTKRNEHTVRFWLAEYQKGGVERLKGISPPGRPSIKGCRIYPVILGIVPESPSKYGYIEAGWTIGMIADYLKREGIEVSAGTIKRVLKKNGWVYKRFSKTTPSNAPTDEEKRKRINEIIEEIKAEQQTQDVEIFFVDESHFENVPYVQRGWFLTGEKKKVETPKKKESKTIIGALNLKTQKVYWKQTDKGNSKSFIEFLYQITQSFLNILIILILDNSSIHKSKKVKDFLKRNPLIKIKLLSPYSPEYNPIERFWLWLKKKVYGNNAYRSIKDVIAKLRKVIWHYHKNRLVDPIKFNFKPYAEIL